MKKKLTILMLTSFMLTGCIKVEDLAAWDPERAFLELPPEILGFLFWQVLICILPVLFVVGGIGIVLLKRPGKQTLGLLMLGLSIGLLLLLAGAPFVYLPLLEALGKQFYPEGLTPEFIFTDLQTNTGKTIAFVVPFVHAIMELVLVAYLVIGGVTAGLTRSWKPLVTILAADIGWLLFYPFIYVETFAAQRFFSQNLALEIVGEHGRVYDFVWSGMIIGNMVLWYFLLPLFVSLILLFIPTGEGGGGYIPIPIFFTREKTNTVWGNPPIYGNPPGYDTNPRLPPPRYDPQTGMPIVDGTVVSEEKKEAPLPGKRKGDGRDEHGNIVTPPPGPDQPGSGGSGVNGEKPLPTKRSDNGQKPEDGGKNAPDKGNDEKPLPSKRTESATKLASAIGSATGHPEVGIAASLAEHGLEGGSAMGRKMTGADKPLPKKRNS